jgi:hypothetical protein
MIQQMEIFILITQIIGFACIGHLLTDFITTLDLPSLPDKPWKCDMCVTFWLSIVPLVVMHGWAGLLYAAISSVLSNYIYKYK